MSRLKELFKQYNLSLVPPIYRSNTIIDTKPLIQFYGENCRINSDDRRTSGYIKCPDCPTSPPPTLHREVNHWFYGQTNSIAYTWAGNAYLGSKEPLSLEILHELIILKNNELELARKKRFNKITNARDVLRVTFKELDIKCQMVSGVPRVDCGPFHLEFNADIETTQVKVNVIYYTGYQHAMELTTFTVADPNLNDKIKAIVNNGTNFKKLMLGEVQPAKVNMVLGDK